MRIDVVTIFSEYLEGPLALSLVGRARELGLLDVRFHDPREHTTDRHRSVDDAPFGGGAGMVMTPEPLFATVEAAAVQRPLFLLSAERSALRSGVSHEELAAGPGFSLICGRYEGVDQRVADHLCDGEISVGDFVLAGGEAAALVVIEAVSRLVPGVLGNEESVDDESFAAGRLEHPQYTRPAEFRGWEVPEVLRSGDHARVARWRRAVALRPHAGAPPGPARRRRRPEPGRSGAARRVPAGAPGSLTSRAPLRQVGSDLRPTALDPRNARAMNPTDLVDRASLRDDIPAFSPGDTVKVHVRVVEGNRERVQVFQGAVIRRQGSGLRETFTVRKVSFGVGVERTFPVHSPIIAKIEVQIIGDVRRAKLYYQRDRIGKAAKIKEKRV